MAIAAAVAALAATGAIAQVAKSDPCQAPPPQRSAENKDAGKPAEKQNGTVDLSRCGGVVKPPATDDGGLIAPAPQTGDMPVVPPDAAPGQQTPK